MRRASIVAALLTCAAVVTEPVAAQFGPIGTRGSQPRGENRTRSAEQDRQEARDAQAAGAIRAEMPAAWEAVRKFRATGRPAMLGITINDRDHGVAVLQVRDGGPASEKGVEPGDLIVAVDGAALIENRRRPRRTPSEALVAHMETVDLGDIVTLTVRRGEAEQDIQVETRALGPDSYFVL